jgi:hypothetical protein
VIRNQLLQKHTPPLLALMLPVHVPAPGPDEIAALHRLHCLLDAALKIHFHYARNKELLKSQ